MSVPVPDHPFAARHAGQPIALPGSSDELVIALLEDEDIDAEQVIRHLARAWPSGVEINRYERLAELEAGVAGLTPDLIFCDLSVPDGRGIELLERVVGLAGPIPVVVLTSVDDPAMAPQALECGAEDYLTKGDYDVELLARTLRHSLARSRADQELRRVAADLRSANTDLEECLVVMAHDLRGPLRTGRLFAERLVAATRAGQDGEPIAAALNESLSRMDTMVERLQLLATLRDNRPTPGLNSLSAAVQQVEVDLGPDLDAAGGHFSVDVDGMVLIDRSLFEDLLRELAMNAIKYRSPDRPLQVRFAVENVSSTSIITVRDNGIGIAPEHRDRVFRLFERLHAEAGPASTDPNKPTMQNDLGRGSGSNGLGFGLASCRRIVELHRGSISLGAPPDGFGVEGRIVLPATPVGARPDESPPVVDSPSPRPMAQQANEGID